MLKSCSVESLINYVTSQIENFFPDGGYCGNLNEVIRKSLHKVEYNFKHIALKHYYKNNKLFFNHLNADQYTVLIYYSSYIAYNEYNDEDLATKLFYLNKVLHQFHCMYDTKLPDIFLLIHGTGIVLGKAEYRNFLVLSQNCNIGANAKLEYPKLSEYVILYPNSSIIGSSIIGSRCCISNGAFINNQVIKNKKLIFNRSPNLDIIDNNKDRFCYFFLKDIHVH